MNKIKDIFEVVLTITDPYYDVQQGLIPGVYENITDGIIDINIATGIDTYEGPWQQSDTGQFTLVTRNPNLDPKVNNNVKYNSKIAFYDTRTIDEYLPIDFNDLYRPFFIGYITDINIEYVRNDNPIITITGIDAFGLLQKTLVTNELEQQAIDVGDPEGIDIESFVSLEAFYNLTPTTGFNFIQGQQDTGGSLPGGSILAYRPAKFFPKTGESLLEIITKYCQTNLDFMYVDYSFGENIAPFPTISFAPFVKYNGAYWAPQLDPIVQYPDADFSSYPADNAPYQNILFDNGYNRVTNQLEFGNEYRSIVGGVIESTNESFGTYASTSSISDWGPVRTNINTCLPQSLATDAEMQRYARDIFDVVASPVGEIQRITFDNARPSDIETYKTYSDYWINQFVRVKHEINPTNIINRLYAICGIFHNISPNSWTTSFSFKPADLEIVYQNQGPAPTITMNSLTGDTNFNFTATLTNYPTEHIDNVIWSLNGFDSYIESYWSGAYSGIDFKDGLPRTGLTQTWNYDDDGILNSPYGPGYWYVTPYVTLDTGWVVAPNIMLTVGTPTPIADFTWSQNLTTSFSEVTFTDTSRNNETGEPNSYLWDFGDGTTSTERNPVHVYDPAPTQTTYSVSLTVYALFGGGTNTKTTTVTLTQPTMTANFTYTQDYQDVTFTNTSTNVGFEEPDAYLWDFGDGITSTLKNPTHTFVADQYVTVTYTVTLTTRNIWEQTATTSQVITITAINSTGSMPIRYVQLRQPSYTPSTVNFYPTMRDFIGRTDGTLENLTFRHLIVHTEKTNVNFYNARGDLEGTTSALESNLRRPSATSPTYNWGIRPAAIVSGSPISYKLTLDLFNLAIYPPATSTQALDNIIMGFKPYTTQPSSYPQLEVWATEYTGSDMTNPNAYTWFKIGHWTLPTGGTLTDSNRVMTATRTLPASYPV